MMEIDIETRRANRAKIVRLLRSGKYKQIKHALSDGCDGRCVLGVVCESLEIPIGDRLQMNKAYTILEDDFGIDALSLFRQNDVDGFKFEDFADFIDMYDGYAGI